MTDLQKTIDLYKGFGIDCVVYEEDEQKIIRLCASYLHGIDDESTVSDKIWGYTGFFTSLHFTLEGKFIKQGIWE